MISKKMSKKQIWFFFILGILSCVPPEKVPVRREPLKRFNITQIENLRKKIPPKLKDKINSTLERVFKKAMTSRTMDEFGIGTMKEAIFIIDQKENSVFFLCEAITGVGKWSREKENPLYWKFKYWCVDIAGYIKDKNLVALLMDIVMDKSERTDVRIRAVRSLKELNEKKQLKKIFDFVENSSVREEIAKVILF